MTVSSPPQPPGPKKGMSPMAWVGIGCAVILFVCALGAGACFYFVKGKVDKFAKNPTFSAMELAMQANPDVEIVSSDEKAGSITVKNKKTGEVVTINTDEFKNGSGKISFKTKDGEGNIDLSGGPNGGIKITSDKGDSSFQMGGGEVKNLPSWVPTYPGGTVQGTLDSTSNGTRSLTFTVKSTDSSDKVMEFYGSKLEADGFKVDRQTYSGGGQSGGTVTGTSKDEKRTLTVIVSNDNGGASALVTMVEKN